MVSPFIIVGMLILVSSYTIFHSYRELFIKDRFAVLPLQYPILMAKQKIVTSLYKRKRTSVALLTLQKAYFGYFRQIPRIVYIKKDVSVAILTLGAVAVVYTTTQNLIASITTFYASFLFFQGILSDMPILATHTHYSVSYADEENGEDAKFWAGSYVQNLGEVDAIDVDISFRICDEYGRPLCMWQDIEQSPTDRNINESGEVISVPKSGTTEICRIPFDRLDEFVEASPPDRTNLNTMFSLSEDMESSSFFVQIKTDRERTVPFLSDRSIIRISTERPEILR